MDLSVEAGERREDVVDGGQDIIARSAFKLLALAGIVDRPEKNVTIAGDTLSGMKIILEETAESLLKVLDEGNADLAISTRCHGAGEDIFPVI